MPFLRNASEPPDAEARHEITNGLACGSQRGGQCIQTFDFEMDVRLDHRMPFARISARCAPLSSSAHVARPRIQQQHVSSTRSVRECADQRGIRAVSNCIASGSTSSRRSRSSEVCRGKHIQTIVEIFTKSTGGDFGTQVAVGGREYAHIQRQWKNAPPRRSTSRSCRTRSSLALQASGISGHFVQQQRAPCACSNLPAWLVRAP